MTNERPRGRVHPSRKALKNRYCNATLAAGLVLFVAGCGSTITTIPFTNTPLPPQSPGPRPAYPNLAAPAPQPVDAKPVLTDDQQKAFEAELEKAANDREAKVKRRLERDKN
jgi:hypothetical protein